MRYLVITGASSGIGRAAATAFRDDGYRVINLSRKKCDVDGIVNILCDLAEPGFRETIQEPLGNAIAEATSLCLIHNAAHLAHDAVHDIDADELRRTYEINLIAPTVLNTALLPAMREGSSIIYVGSTLGEKAVPGSFSYVTSKHASIGMMRATCQDLAGTGIHTACINPGFTDTDMLHDHIPSDVIPTIKQMSTFGRLIDPVEIGRALLFAAQNPVINGSVINANLGQIER